MSHQFKTGLFFPLLSGILWANLILMGCMLSEDPASTFSSVTNFAVIAFFITTIIQNYDNRRVT